MSAKLVHGCGQMYLQTWSLASCLNGGINIVRGFQIVADGDSELNA
jgi:hypothetical protein